MVNKKTANEWKVHSIKTILPDDTVVVASVAESVLDKVQIAPEPNVIMVGTQCGIPQVVQPRANVVSKGMVVGVTQSLGQVYSQPRKRIRVFIGALVRVEREASLRPSSHMRIW